MLLVASNRLLVVPKSVFSYKTFSLIVVKNLETISPCYLNVK